MAKINKTAAIAKEAKALPTITHDEAKAQAKTALSALLSTNETARDAVYANRLLNGLSKFAIELRRKWTACIVTDAVKMSNNASSFDDEVLQYTYCDMLKSWLLWEGVSVAVLVNAKGIRKALLTAFNANLKIEVSADGKRVKGTKNYAEGATLAAFLKSLQASIVNRATNGTQSSGVIAHGKTGKVTATAK